MSSSSKPTTSIDDLPAEMISELFRHLPPKDLAACSLVAKRWYSIYSSFRLDRLVVENVDYHGKTWWYEYPAIEGIKLRDLKLFNRLADQPLISKLKHFALRADKVDFDLNRLNQFKQLLRLEVTLLVLDGKKVKLNLPKLKVLRFSNPDQSSDYSLSVDCPQLEVLCYCGPVNRFVVKHPETIVRLTMFGSKLSSFKNVEYLASGFRTICQKTLLLLPKLKEFHYISSIEAVMDRVFENRIGAVDEIKETLRKFVNDVRLLRGSNFKFRFSGLNLASKASVDKIDFGVKVLNGKEYVSNEYFYVKNHRLIDPDATLPFVDDLDYVEMMRHVPEDLPNSFFKKFTQLDRVIENPRRASRIDKSHFLSFLMSVGSVKKLVLDFLYPRYKPTQAFFDQLPSFAHSLYELELLLRPNFELRLNFEFIGKLPQFQVPGLSFLHIIGYLSAESAISLIRHLDKLREVSFRFRWEGRMFYVSKERDSNVFGVDEKFGYSKFGRILTPLEQNMESADEILNFLKGIQIDPPAFSHLFD